MDQQTIRNAALQFGTNINSITPIGGGLIHKTFKVDFSTQQPIILQNVNKNTFPLPEYLIDNYHVIYNYLNENPAIVSVPGPALTLSEEDFFIDVYENFWRATYFQSDCYCPDGIKNKFIAKDTALAFASFTHALKGLGAHYLFPVLPGFHNLDLRFTQFEESIKNAGMERLQMGQVLIDELKKRYPLVELYRKISSSPDFRLRIMHHDCKVSNVLFDNQTAAPVVLVDLDTTMPGLFFSDVGDMIRSMACTEGENSTNWNEIAIDKEMYEAITEGYIEGLKNDLSTEEKSLFHSSGHIIIYMQALRFMTDFLNDDVYYQINYPHHNIDRAKNQMLLLKSLEEMKL